MDFCCGACASFSFISRVRIHNTLIYLFYICDRNDRLAHTQKTKYIEHSLIPSEHTMKNIILLFFLAAVIVVVVWFLRFFLVTILNCRLENEYNNNNAVVGRCFLHTKKPNRMKTKLTKREREQKKYQQNFIYSTWDCIYADQTKWNKNKKPTVPLTVCVSLVSFFFSFVFHFSIGLLFICLSFANFCLFCFILSCSWIKNIFNEKTTTAAAAAATEFKLFILMHLLVLLTVLSLDFSLNTDACWLAGWLAVCYSSVCLFSLLKLHDWNVTNENDNKYNKNNIKTDHISIHNHDYDIHYGTQYNTINDIYK